MTIKEGVLPTSGKPTSLAVRRAERRNKQRLRTAQIVQISLFLGALYVFGILSLALPKPVESVVEKRELAKLPAFSSEALIRGSYTKDLEFFYADTFPFRDSFVSFAASLDELRGIRFDGVRIHGAPVTAEQPPSGQPDPAPQQPDPDPSEAAVLPPATQEESQPAPPVMSNPPAVEDDGALGEQMGAVFVYKDRAFSMFGGSKAMGERYAQAINAYQTAWGGSAQVYDMVIPTAIEFALPQRYSDVSMPQRPNIQHIYSNLDSRVKAVDAYSSIAAHTGEYIYFNADHHWTGLGAYYAYRAYCESAGLEPLELSQYERRTITGFRGTMYAYTNDAKLAEDFVDYYIMPVDCTAVRYDRGEPHNPKPHSVWADYATGGNSYSVFLHGDFPLVKVNTDNRGGRKALVVKESFGNAFAPFLLPHYEEVHIVDQRYFELSLAEYVRDNGIQDVIFANNIFAANTAYHIDRIAGMMAGNPYIPPAQNQQPPIEPEQNDEELAVSESEAQGEKAAAKKDAAEE